MQFYPPGLTAVLRGSPAFVHGITDIPISGVGLVLVANALDPLAAAVSEAPLPPNVAAAGLLVVGVSRSIAPDAIRVDRPETAKGLPPAARCGMKKVDTYI